MKPRNDPYLAELLSYYTVKPTLRKQKRDHRPKTFEYKGRTFAMCDSCKLWVKLPTSGIVSGYLQKHELGKGNQLCVHCTARLEYQYTHLPSQAVITRFTGYK